MTTNATSVDQPLAKSITAILMGMGIANWSDVAAFLAALYTLILLCEWFWKRFARPRLEARGWLKRTRRRREDIYLEE